MTACVAEVMQGLGLHIAGIRKAGSLDLPYYSSLYYVYVRYQVSLGKAASVILYSASKWTTSEPSEKLNFK
jgi:hypothetical protein